MKGRIAILSCAARACFGAWLMLVVSAAVHGQSTTGGLGGTVRDSTGNPLSGVIVEISSPALQGLRKVVTEGDGRFRFFSLPPRGGYELAATLEGYAPARARSRVFLGAHGTVLLTLHPAISDSVTVTAETPLVDVTSTTTGLNVTATQFESLPTRRQFQALAGMAPGVSMELGEKRGDFARSPAVAGASPPENNYLIEGISTTATVNGISGTNLTMNFVEEVQVLTGAYSAEFGRSTGGIFNVVTKSGSNDLQGDLFGYYQADAWSERNVRRGFRGTTTKADGVDSLDVGATVGGPIQRDRLWFFAAYDPTRSTTYTREYVDRTGAFVEEQHESELNTDLFAAKLTWAMSRNHQLVATTFGDPTIRKGWLGGARVDAPVALRQENRGSMNFGLRYAGLLIRAVAVEALVGRHNENLDVAPTTELGRTVPRQIDNTTGAAHGGYFATFDESGIRDQFLAKATYFGRTHQLTIGADIHQSRYTSSGYDWVFYFDGPVNFPIGRYDRIREQAANWNGFGALASRSAFVQDQWELFGRLQLHGGVRFEQQILDSSQGILIADRHESDRSLNAHRVSDLALDQTLAPRIGIVWDPKGNGRTKLYAHAGRYFESLPLTPSVLAQGRPYVEYRYYNRVPQTSNDWYNPFGSPLSEDWTRIRSFDYGFDDTAFVFDANLRTQFQDEVRVGAEYQFAPGWSAGAHYVKRGIGRVIEDFGLFQNPEDPIDLTGYIIGNPSEGPFGEIFPEPRRDYEAVELVVQRRHSGNWQMQSSFVWARSEGDYEGLYRSNNNQHAANVTTYYDLPALQRNAYGRLPADRPYHWKLHGSYMFPFGVTISEAFSLSAGAPLSKLGPELPNDYRGAEIFLTPRGSEGRAPAYWVLDLHTDYQFEAINGAVSLIADVFNATNNHEAIATDEAYVYLGMPGWTQWSAPENLDEYRNPRFNPDLPPSPYYGTPSVYQSPRTVQIGIKFRY